MSSFSLFIVVRFIAFVGVDAFISTRDMAVVSCHQQRQQQSSMLHMSGLFGDQSKLGSEPKKKKSRNTDWEIYIDQSKSSLDRGGSATLDAFCGLVAASNCNIKIIPAIFPKSNKKGPWIRCISNLPQVHSLDVSNVDSVDKVYRILTKHLKIKEVSMEACECLKWKYKGNSHLEAGKIQLAIDAYNKSLEKCNDKKQEGIILLLRASAYLQQAQSQKQALQITVQEWELPDSDEIQATQALLQLAVSSSSPSPPKETTPISNKKNNDDDDDLSSVEKRPAEAAEAAATFEGGLANSLLMKLQNDGIRQQGELRQIQYLHGLYQYSLLRAAQDSLRSVELLPNYCTSWLRAGELLSELWKLKESRQYYEQALTLDASLGPNLEAIVEGIERRQELLDQVQAQKDWTEDSLRLALDIAG